MVYNNSYRISRKSRNWLSAIRRIRYLRYLSVISSMIDNQAFGQNIDIPTDTSSAIFKHPQKVRRNSFPTSFLPENQCSILNYAEWYFLHFVHLGHFRKSLKCTKCTKCHMFFISPFSFHLSVFTGIKTARAFLPALKYNSEFKIHNS